MEFAGSFSIIEGKGGIFERTGEKINKTINK